MLSSLSFCRGTADAGQVRITGHYYTEKWTIYNTTLDVYYAPYASFVGGLWPQLLPAVKRATAATDSPSTANIYITGHSLGAASAYMAGLSLKEAGFRVSGVYAFDPYHVGYSCEAGQACWVSLYEQHLGDVTYSWWNNQDPVRRRSNLVWPKSRLPLCLVCTVQVSTCSCSARQAPHLCAMRLLLLPDAEHDLHPDASPATASYGYRISCSRCSCPFDCVADACLPLQCHCNTSFTPADPSAAGLPLSGHAQRQPLRPRAR